jgi:hypothetical protein
MQATKELIPAVIQELNRDDRVVFAYLYGSVAADGIGRDMDIAVYSQPDVDIHLLAADLKISLHIKTGLSPDLFDIRIINTLAQEGDVFSLLYLQRVLSTNFLLVDKDSNIRSDFLERYGWRYRECEGLIQEVLA